MSDTRSHEVKALKNALEDIENGGKKKCTLCRFVLFFAFGTLLLVLIFVFFTRAEPVPPLRPVSPDLVLPPSPETYQREMLDLVRLFHPEVSTSTTPAPNIIPK